MRSWLIKPSKSNWPTFRIFLAKRPNQPLTCQMRPSFAFGLSWWDSSLRMWLIFVLHTVQAAMTLSPTQIWTIRISVRSVRTLDCLSFRSYSIWRMKIRWVKMKSTKFTTIAKSVIHQKKEPTLKTLDFSASIPAICIRMTSNASKSKTIYISSLSSIFKWSSESKEPTHKCFVRTFSHLQMDGLSSCLTQALHSD